MPKVFEHLARPHHPPVDMDFSGDRRNLPMQKYLEKGYFVVVPQQFVVDGKAKMGHTTKITPKGERWLVHYMKKDLLFYGKSIVAREPGVNNMPRQLPGNSGPLFEGLH